MGDHLPPESVEKGTSGSTLSSSADTSKSTSAVETVTTETVEVVPFSSLCIAVVVDAATELGTLILVASSCIVYSIIHTYPAMITEFMTLQSLPML